MHLQKQHLNRWIKVRAVLSGESEWKMATTCHPFQSRKHITMLRTSEQYEHDLSGSGTLLDYPWLHWGCLGITENIFWITGVSAVIFLSQHLSWATNKYTFLPPHFISNSNKFQDLLYKSVNTNFTHSTFFSPSLENTEEKNHNLWLK